MSLKAIHIFFIALSVLLAFGFSLWALESYAQGEQSGMLIVALLSFAAGVGLAAYGIVFLRKLKHVSFL